MSNIEASPDGAIDDWFVKTFGKSWKTTFAGVLTLACGVARAIPTLPPIVHVICDVVVPTASGIGLWAAKDHNVSGKPGAFAP